MEKKDRQNELKRWKTHFMAASLAQQCHQRDRETGDGASGGYDGTIKQSTLSAVLFGKAAVVMQRL